MTEPRPIRDILPEALAAIRSLAAQGPQLNRLDLSVVLYDALHREHVDRYSHYGLDSRPWLGVPVFVDRALPPWARREHWSDGRVVTRYRLVMPAHGLTRRWMIGAPAVPLEFCPLRLGTDYPRAGRFTITYPRLTQTPRGHGLGSVNGI